MAPTETDCNIQQAIRISQCLIRARQWLRKNESGVTGKGALIGFQGDEAPN